MKYYKLTASGTSTQSILYDNYRAAAAEAEKFWREAKDDDMTDTDLITISICQIETDEAKEVQ